jgi:hypothetical protein
MANQDSAQSSHIRARTHRRRKSHYLSAKTASAKPKTAMSQAAIRRGRGEKRQQIREGQEKRQPMEKQNLANHNFKDKVFSNKGTPGARR